MFWIRYKDASGVTIEKALHPGPTDVEYPEERRAMTMTTSVDGNVIVQRPLRDSRLRKWIWASYKPGVFPPYDILWAELQGLEYRARLDNSLDPVVEIWEDIIPDGGFGSLDGSDNRIYTKVKLLRVDRTPNKGGGTVSYSASTVTFCIADDLYTGF